QSISTDQKNALRHLTGPARLLLVCAASADRRAPRVEETRCPNHQGASSVGSPAWEQPARTARARGSSQSHPEFPLVWFQSAHLSESRSKRAACFLARCRGRPTLVRRGKLSGCSDGNVRHTGKDRLGRNRALDRAERAARDRSALRT